MGCCKSKPEEKDKNKNNENGTKKKSKKSKKDKFGSVRMTDVQNASDMLPGMRSLDEIEVHVPESPTRSMSYEGQSDQFNTVNM